MMDRVFDLMQKWTPQGQGLFLIFMVLIFVAVLGGVFRFVLVLIRGWPPKKSEGEESADDD